MIISLLALTGVMIDFFYSDNIEQSVTKNIQSKLKSKVNFSDVKFTLWEHFPYASVQFNNILALEGKGFNNDTLIYAKEIFIDINIMDIISKKYNINRVNVLHAIININYDKNNSPNFLIFETDTSSKIFIQQIALLNTKVNYNRVPNNTNINWDIAEATFDLNKKDVAVNASLFSNQLFIGKMDYLYNKECSVLGKLTIKKDTFLINSSKVLIENVSLDVSGAIVNKNKLDLNIASNSQELNSIINHMPVKFKKICAPFVAQGIFDCNATVKGVISKSINPSFNMDFKISNGDFKLKSRPFILSNINTSGNINNGESSNFQSTKITCSKFSANPKNGSINGMFTVNNLNKYFLTAKLNSTWDLSEVNHYFEDSPFFDLTGKLTASTNYKGNLAFDKKFKDYFINSIHTSETNLSNINFKYLNSKLDFNIDSVNCSFDNNIINIKNSSLNISESNLMFTGKLEGFISYLLQKTDKIYMRGELNSSKIFFKELMTIKDISKNRPNSNHLPDWISLDISTYISNFKYNDFNAKNLTGKLKYNNQVLRGFGLSANSLEGSLNGDFVLTEPTNNYLVLKTNLDFKKINIRKSFKVFNNFNQDFIRQNELNGLGTAELEVEAHWKPSFIFNDKKLKIKSHLIIEEGELIDFKPLENLSSFVSLDDLKHVKFSTLENTIEVENKIITIPAMEINSSALSVFLSGTHTFDQKIDYSIKLLLSELLSNTFRKKNTTINNEFGEINEEGQIFTTVYLKMTGDTDNPTISFDGLKIKEDIQESISTEIETIKTIIKEDVLKLEKPLEKEPGQDVIIEWEDEKKYNPK